MTAGEAPTLTTERLLLRPWRAEDRAPFATLNGDPVVMEHFPATLTPAESEALAHRIEADLAARGWGLWAVEVRGLAPFIGYVGLHPADFEAPFTPAVEVGWRLDRPYWGQGYATEGGQAALRFGFEELGLEEIVSFTSLTNTASQRVMERLGMATVPEDDFDHPRVPADHRVRRHALYRLRRQAWQVGGTS
jgi:RimJ/RimL family protein N-acetyltransferase